MSFRDIPGMGPYGNIRTTEPPPGVNKPTGSMQMSNQTQSQRKEEEEASGANYYFSQPYMYQPEKEVMSSTQSQVTGYGTMFYNPAALPMSRLGLSQYPCPPMPHAVPTSINNNFNLGFHQQLPNSMVGAIGPQTMMGQPHKQAPLPQVYGRATEQITNMSGDFSYRPPRGFDSASHPGHDLSEFPSLVNTSLPSAASASAGPNYVDMMTKQAPDPTPEFNISQEDFPALPGAQNPPVPISTPCRKNVPCRACMQLFAGVQNPVLGVPVLQDSLESGPGAKHCPQTFQAPPVTGDFQLGFQLPALQPGNFQQFTCKAKGGEVALPKLQIQTHPGTVFEIPKGMVTDHFGIAGLLSYLQAAETEPELSGLARGVDLTTLSPNLNSPKNIYSTFQSPWAERPCRPQDIDYYVPQEYFGNSFSRRRLAGVKLNRFGEDVLFYMFYMNGGDVLQLAAAAELYSRDWRYHKEERLWLIRPPGSEPVVKNGKSECGTYYFFDPSHWQKFAREFYLEYDKLEEMPTFPESIYY